MILARMIFVAYVLILLVLVPANAEAVENRCQELGANCVCSSTFDTPSWINHSQSWYYESNQPANRCAEGPNDSIWSLPDPAVSDVETGMPAGNTVDHVLKETMTVTGGFTAREGIASLTGRVCSRVYVWLSSDWETTLQGSCTNDKYIQVGRYLAAFSNRFSQNIDGAEVWNDPQGGFISPDNCKNKWCRLEVCVNSVDSPSTWEFYYYNVDDGGSELSATKNSSHAEITEVWAVNGYREGTCSGFRRFSHAMVAHWPTNAGQRIGPAYEIEGRLGNDNTPPAPPKGLRIMSGLWEWFSLSALRSHFPLASLNPTRMMSGASCELSSPGRYPRE